ncbi:CLOCK-interacting pacemaker isoform 1-T2 [Discoglossus pictus]
MEKGPPSETAQERVQPRPRERLKNTRRALESDKDSGYSDVASECQSSIEQTDSEEISPTSLWCATEAPSGYPQGNPLVILKNLLVGQESCPDPQAHPWTIRPSFQLLQPSPQILLFPPSASSPKSQSTFKQDTKYLPILNSYTKIAPQPPQPSPSSSLPCKVEKGAVIGHHSQAKRTCPEAPSSDGTGIPETTVHIGKVQRGTAATSKAATAKRQGNNLQVWSLDTVNTDSNTLSYNETPQSMVSEKPEQQCKTHRFQNTLDVLHRSGLLTIAMKTKELARLNQASQIQLERLKEQMQLYTKAMSSNHLQDWQKLQDSLAGGVQGTKTNTTFKELKM